MSHLLCLPRWRLSAHAVLVVLLQQTPDCEKGRILHKAPLKSPRAASWSDVSSTAERTRRSTSQHGAMSQLHLFEMLPHCIQAHDLRQGFCPVQAVSNNVFKMFGIRPCWHLVLWCPQTASTCERIKQVAPAFVWELKWRPVDSTCCSNLLLRVVSLTDFPPDTQQPCSLYAVVNPL